MKYLITGGSGFIGTNLILKLLEDKRAQILNIDNTCPKIKSHEKIWKSIDICDKEKLTQAITDFSPDYVIHLAARTDLKGNKIEDYNANIQGVSNLLEALNQIPNLKRVIFTSSMYVCQPGYIPQSFEDYKPHTLYGESKVQTEKIVKKYNPLTYTWTIIRPTSIWGPWFGEPYNKFFRIVLSHYYFHLGKRVCKKTYGYIDNTVYQIMSILQANEGKVHRSVFYLGDYESYDISQWANEIASFVNIRIPTVPFFLFLIAAWIGDCLKLFGIDFPMTSFRLKNMITNNIQDLNPIKEIVPNLPILRKDGTKITIQWIKTQ